MNFNSTSTAMLAAWFMRRTAPRGVRRVAQFDAALASDIGSVREENQDRVAIVRGRDHQGQPFILAMLADGMGGMKAGAECAALTLGAFIDSLVTDARISKDAPGEWLIRGAHRANKAVHSKFAGEGGSTLVAALLMEGVAPHWLSVGDSRAYQAGLGHLRQLSLDDTLEGQLGKASAGRSRDLLQFIGIGDALEPHIGAMSSDSATILLTSDGVHFINADLLAKVIYHAPNLGYCANRLTDLAKMLGGPDNASVVAVSFNALKVNVETHISGVYEVWDPFGELQVMFASYSHSETSSQQSRQVVDPLVEPNLMPVKRVEGKPVVISRRKSISVDGQAVAANKSAPKKTKTVRRRRNVSSDSDSVSKSEEATKDLQLFIEFPNKKS